jgi:hypothetical protein
MITKAQLDKRIAHERQAVRYLIRAAKKAGYATTGVYDGGDERIKCSTEKAAMEAVFAVDDSTIYFKHPDQPKGHCVVIVLGNSGAECIADNSVGPLWDEVMADVFKYCETLDTQ